MLSKKKKKSFVLSYTWTPSSLTGHETHKSHFIALLLCIRFWHEKHHGKIWTTVKIQHIWDKGHFPLLLFYFYLSVVFYCALSHDIKRQLYVPSAAANCQGFQLLWNLLKILYGYKNCRSVFWLLDFDTNHKLLCLHFATLYYVKICF